MSVAVQKRTLSPLYGTQFTVDLLNVVFRVVRVFRG